jgi:hypothetical protein
MSWSLVAKLRNNMRVSALHMGGSQASESTPQAVCHSDVQRLNRSWRVRLGTGYDGTVCHLLFWQGGVLFPLWLYSAEWFNDLTVNQQAFWEEHIPLMLADCNLKLITVQTVGPFVWLISTHTDFYEDHLKSSWTRLITPSRNLVEVRWRSLFRSTFLGKQCASYNAPSTSRKRSYDHLKKLVRMAGQP